MNQKTCRILMASGQSDGLPNMFPVDNIGGVDGIVVVADSEGIVVGDNSAAEAGMG